MLRIFIIFWLPSVNSYVDLEQYQIQVITFLVPIISSILLTFGFVIMVNQRLNLEIFEEKENKGNLTIRDMVLVLMNHHLMRIYLLKLLLMNLEK